MQWLCDMAGSPPKLLQVVPVVKNLHAMSCPKGGFPSIRHNEVRALTATLLTEVCHDVCVEPDLQPLTGEQMNNATAITDAGARLDIAANGFWGGRFERTSEFSTHMLNPISTARSLHAIGNTKGLKRGHMNKEFVR